MATLITDVKVILTAPEGINLVVVKVETNQPGLYGLGCATFAYRHLAVKCLIEEYLRPLLIGRDAQAIEELWQLMHQNAYWRNGPIENNAISGIDMALWDIKGKLAEHAAVPAVRRQVPRGRADLPPCRRPRRRRAVRQHPALPRAGHHAHPLPERRLRRRRLTATAPAQRAASARPRASTSTQRKYMRDTVKLFDDIRSRVGFDVALCHDVHERLKPVDAIRFACELEPYDLFFLEDAIALEEGEWLRQLRAKTNIPLAQGELFNHPFEWRTLIAERLIDFIRVHLSQIGGITPGRKLQIFAEQFGVRTAWHGPGDMSPLAHAANIHIDLASRNFGVQEWSGTEPPNFVIQELKGPRGALLDVFPGLPEFRNGYVYANDKPGLGVDLDETRSREVPLRQRRDHLDADAPGRRHPADALK